MNTFWLMFIPMPDDHVAFIFFSNVLALEVLSGAQTSSSMMKCERLLKRWWIIDCRLCVFKRRRQAESSCWWRSQFIWLQSCCVEICLYCSHCSWRCPQTTWWYEPFTPWHHGVTWWKECDQVVIFLSCSPHRLHSSQLCLMTCWLLPSRPWDNFIGIVSGKF